MRRRRPYSHRRQKRSLELLWPFLLIILIGVIFILLIQFVMTWFDQRETELKNKVYFYLDEGTAQVLPWGETEWTKAYDQLVLEGDVVRMGSASRGTMKFFNDTAVRLDSDARLEIESITTGKDEDVVYLDLDSGNTWLNVIDKEEPIRFVVNTDNLRVTSFGTIFEVGMTDRETVRVMSGEVMVEVLENSGGREIVLEQVKVGVGQQVQVTANDVAKIQSRQPVSLLEAIDDEWKETTWYTWNVAQDSNPTDFSGRELDEPIVEEPVVEEPVVEEPEVDEPVVEEPEDEEEVVFDSVAPIVRFTTPDSSPETLTVEEAQGTYSLHGTTSENTAKVTVTSYDASGKASPYTLNGYEAGDTTWRYGAAHDFGNLREGRNLFTVVSENGSGVKSKEVEVIVEVPEGAFDVEEEEEVVEETEETETTEEDTTEEVVEEEEDEEAEVIEGLSDDPLAFPTVKDLNDSPLPANGRYSSGAEVITIVGGVSTSTAKVYVNNYELGKYVPGSGEWSYIVRPEFLNFDVGLNTYTVVAEAADGTQKNFKFEIYRVAP
jgi:hypothetical protein